MDIPLSGEAVETELDLPSEEETGVALPIDRGVVEDTGVDIPRGSNGKTLFWLIVGRPCCGEGFTLDNCSQSWLSSGSLLRDIRRCCTDGNCDCWMYVEAGVEDCFISGCGDIYFLLGTAGGVRNGTGGGTIIY